MLTRFKRFISQRTSKLCNKLFCLPIFSVLYMHHLLYLIFRCDFDVMENLESLEELGELNTAKYTLQYTCFNFSLVPATRSSWVSLSGAFSFEETVSLKLKALLFGQTRQSPGTGSDGEAPIQGLAWLFGWQDARIVESMCEACNSTVQVSLSILPIIMWIYLRTSI